MADLSYANYVSPFVECRSQTLLDELKTIIPSTSVHCRRVNQLASLFASRLGLPEQEQAYLHIGTLLHDIGKAEVGAGIIQKTACLTVEEWAKIKEHPARGYKQLLSEGFHDEIAKVALFHHERYDGLGYPFGLAGDEIPALARICAILDAFDAMISRRPYRSPLTIDAAFHEIHSNRGTQFDPELVEEFLQLQPYFFRETIFGIHL